MSVIDTSYSLHGFVPLFPSSGSRQQCSSTAIRLVLDEEGWRPLIDQQLVEWGLNPASLEDDGVSPPSAIAIHLASRLALILRDRGQRAPTRIVPDGSGGISFEWESDRIFTTVNISPSGAIEGALFKDGRIEARLPLAEPIR
jgi:hypothetical protein